MAGILQVDVYVAPAIPAVTGFSEPSKSVWSPISCTLIQGPTSCVLVDTPVTSDLTHALVKWVRETAPGKKLAYIYTTHVSAPTMQQEYRGESRKLSIAGPWRPFLWQPNHPRGISRSKSSSHKLGCRKHRQDSQRRCLKMGRPLPWTNPCISSRSHCIAREWPLSN
jgi:hypothetical protein